MPITDAQLLLLRAALQRDDGLLSRPGKLAGAALARIEASLTRAGLVEPVPVGADQPYWRKDTDAEIGLRITDAGRAAIGVEPTPPSGQDGADDALPPDSRDGPDRERAATGPAVPVAPRSFRPGSKAALLVVLLSKGEGAGVEGLAAALSWQPHTVRAALTRLRQDGFVVTTRKDAQNGTLYRIAGATAPGPALAAADEVA